MESAMFATDVFTAETITEITAITNTITSTEPLHVADAAFDKDIRIIVLYIEVILGTVGGFGVCLWLWFNRRRKSRVNQLIMHVVISDLTVIFGACLPQLIWEYDRRWKAGDAGCRIVKFMQSFSMMASNNMLVVLSLDRLQAIRWPLRTPIAVWKMTLAAWVVAGLLSVPQVAVFHQNFVDAPNSQFSGMWVCESIWRSRPLIERQIYLTYVGIVVFEIPFVIIMVCYISIFCKISKKAGESSAPGKHSKKPGKIHLQSTGSSSLSKAKIKTLKMTIVILTTFIICGIPYHILEGIYNFGSHDMVPATVAAIIGAMAVANSATNPYVFLLFNANDKCLTGIRRCGKKQDMHGTYESTVGSRTEYTTADTRTDYNSTFSTTVASNGARDKSKYMTYPSNDSKNTREYMKLNQIKPKEETKSEYSRVAVEEVNE